MDERWRMGWLTIGFRGRGSVVHKVAVAALVCRGGSSRVLLAAVVAEVDACAGRSQRHYLL